MRTHIRYPGMVLLLWASYSSLPRAAAPPPGAPACPDHGKFAPASPVLESLECRNDYLTHIRCSWTEAPGAPLSLFHLDRDDSSVLPCVAGDPVSENVLEHPRAQCRYNTSLFAIGFDDVFFFNTPHSSGVSAIINLAQHVLTSDPRDSRQAPDARLTGRPDRERLIEIEKPKREEEDRNGEVMPEERRETDGLPGPFNLQCVYDREREVRCSWEMMRELSQYILYRLSYRTKPHAPSQWCCAVLDGDGGGDDDDGGGDEDAVRFSCSFSVSAAELLLVHLSPEPQTKVIQSHKHIEPAVPIGLHVALLGEDWVLNWTLPKYRTVPISSELRYWSAHFPEDMETLLLPAGVSVYVVAERSLWCSVRYLAQVRSTVTSRRVPGARYAGHPSHWSQPVDWTTRPAPDSSRVYLLLAASVSVALILIYFTLLAFHRRVRVWEVSLPSPFQSKVLQAVCQSLHPPPPVLQSRSEHLPSHTEVDDPCMSEAYILGRIELTTHMPSSDVIMPPGSHSNGPYQYAYQEGCCITELHNQVAEMWHYPAFQGGLSVHEDLMGVEIFMSNGRFMCLASNSHNALQPCSDGYQSSPLANGDITQDALLNVHLDDVEMFDAYMDCPK